MAIRIICNTCGASFDVPQSRLKWGNPQFCSKACYEDARANPPQLYLCQICGGEFMRRPRQGHEHLVCSPTCQAVWHSTVTKGKPHGSPERRFLRYVERARTGKGPNDCWIWPGKLFRNGYGMFYLLGTCELAHRRAFKMLKGPLDDDELVCHHCDVKPCINPSHLFAGSHQDNIRDMVAKGRHNPPRGARHRSAKLNPTEVLQIFALKGTAPCRVIGQQFHVSISTVHGIHTEKYWKHLTTGTPRMRPPMTWKAKGTHTRFWGVSIKRKKWRARIKHQGKEYALGVFATEEEAARAYDAKARELLGETAAVNFPSHLSVEGA